MDTIIEFVGLCVFTSQLAGGSATAARVAPGAADLNHYAVVAIMPQVSGDAVTKHRISPASPPSSKKLVTTSTSSAVPAQHEEMSDVVEAHTAMIVFDQASQMSIKGWTTQTLNDQGWVYIELSGEKINFVTDTTNVDINLPNHLALPHLGQTPLTSPYTPAKNYSGAAAVFTISKGTLSACQNASSPNGAAGRIDTKLTLHTAKKLIITTASGDKSVTLAAGAQIIAGNVPIAFAKPPHIVSANARQHYMVYCAMIGQATCTWPAPLATTITDPMSGCATDLAYREANHPPLPPVAANDFACSNTQWP